VGRGPDRPSARALAYQALSHIQFDGMHFRRDIAGSERQAIASGG
jgi:phosphoribosylamine-glycine ligase